MARIILIAFAVAMAFSAPAASRFESVTLSLQKPMDQASLTKMEQDLREIRGFSGVTWNLNAGRCSVTIDSTVLCKEDLIKQINLRTLDGKPVVAPFVLPDLHTSLKEIRSLVASMEESFNKSKQTKALLPYLDRLTPHLEDLAAAARAKASPKEKSTPDPLFTKVHTLTLCVYKVQAAAKREYAKTTETGLAELRSAVEDLARLLKPPADATQGAPASKKPEPEA